jgi:hypothetical protein
VRLASCQMHLTTGFFCEGRRRGVLRGSRGIAAAGRAGPACEPRESSTRGKPDANPAAHRPAHGNQKIPAARSVENRHCAQAGYSTYGFTVASLAGAGAALPPLARLLP